MTHLKDFDGEVLEFDKDEDTEVEEAAALASEAQPALLDAESRPAAEVAENKEGAQPPSTSKATGTDDKGVSNFASLVATRWRGATQASTTNARGERV